MDKAKQPGRQTAKEKKLKILFSITAILLVIVIAWLLMLKNSGAWLLDKGEWSHATYTLGYIDYTYEVNNKQVDVSNKGDITLAATVPLIGAVKLNDQADDPNADYYEKYAENNFNEGVTVAHIKIVNKSTFAINMSYAFSFKDMFDSASNPQDLFYLILPQAAVVNTVDKTITIEGKLFSYKSYIKEVLNGATDYENMITALKSYYETDAGKALKTGKVQMDVSKPGEKEEAMELNILFWSEYNAQLPFVTTNEASQEQLKPVSDPISQLAGNFTMKISSSQQVDVTE